MNTNEFDDNPKLARFYLTALIVALLLAGFSVLWLFLAPTLFDMHSAQASAEATTFHELIEAAKLRSNELLLWLGPTAASLGLALVIASVLFGSRRQSESSTLTD